MVQMPLNAFLGYQSIEYMANTFDEVLEITAWPWRPKMLSETLGALPAPQKHVLMALLAIYPSFGPYFGVAVSRFC